MRVSAISFGQGNLGQRIGEWTDRTGSARYSTSIAGWRHYYPYGEEITATSGDTYKFAQLYRDADTGLDYAVNRYFSTGNGRFTTPDPYSGSMQWGNPQSFNRYSYVQNDPLNLTDPTGLRFEISCLYSSAPYFYFPPDGVPQAITLITGITCVGSSVPGGGGEIGGEKPPGSRLAGNPTVQNLAKDGPVQTMIIATLDLIASSIDDDCKKFLETDPRGPSLQSELSFLVGDRTDTTSGYIGYGEITPTFVAATTSLAPGYAIVVNTLGAFFSGSQTVNGESRPVKVAKGRITGGTDLARVFILLHELAHAMKAEAFESDGYDSKPGAGDRNDQRILDNCKKTLKKFGY